MHQMGAVRAVPEDFRIRLGQVVSDLNNRESQRGISRKIFPAADNLSPWGASRGIGAFSQRFQNCLAASFIIACGGVLG